MLLTKSVRTMNLLAARAVTPVLKAPAPSFSVQGDPWTVRTWEAPGDTLESRSPGPLPLQ